MELTKGYTDMKTMRTKILGFLTAALIFASIGLFAGAASAQKIYTMAVQSTGANTVSVKFTNVTPPSESGNSTINSFVINKPNSGWIFAPGSSSAPASVTIGADGNAYVSAFTGLKAGGRNPNTITITLQVNYGTGGAPACGSPINWTALAYTGNFSNTTFQLVDINNNNSPISSVPESLNCYALTGLPAMVAAGTSNQPVAVSLKNNNAPGGPSITTLTVAASPGVTAAVAAFLPVAPGVTATINVTVNTACGATTPGTWSSSATGSGSSTFTGSTAAASYTVKPCILTFASGTPPSRVASGVAVTPVVTVTAKDGNGTLLPWNGAVTWSLIAQTSGDSGTVNGGAGTCVDTGTCSTWQFPALTITFTTGIGNQFTLKGTATLGTAVGNTVATSSPFTAFTGTLGCYPSVNYKAGALDPSDPIAYVLAADEGKYGLIRGQNKDGVNCSEVPYQFILDITTTPQKAKFIVPPVADTGQLVSAEYVVVWKAVPVVAMTNANSGWTINRPKLAWKTCTSAGDGCIVVGDPVYIPALSCVRDPYDLALVPNGDLQLLLPNIPNVAPFNTPPYNTYYTVGSKALMCVAQQGWTSVGTDGSGNTLVRYWTKVIDQGDGFVIND